MKRFRILCLSALTLCILASHTSAAGLIHTVVRGDTMWKVASKYEVGTREVIDANTQIKNPDLIYPGDRLNIPQLSSSVLNVERQVISLVNEIRVQNGLSALTENWQLSRVARYKSQDMADLGYFSHNSPTYGTPFQMMKQFGITYRSAGENIANGYSTAQAVVNAWMNSPGHRANILNASYSQIGVGYVARGNHWTQMFIG